MSIFFIFMVAVLNLALGFGLAVVIKRRSMVRIATEPSGQAEEDLDVEEEYDSSVDDAAEEAIEAVEDLLSQAGLQPIATTETDEAEETDEADETDEVDETDEADESHPDETEFDDLFATDSA